MEGVSRSDKSAEMSSEPGRVVGERHRSGEVVHVVHVAQDLRERARA
jgi:hypothetical protein